MSEDGNNNLSRAMNHSPKTTLFCVAAYAISVITSEHARVSLKTLSRKKMPNLRKRGNAQPVKREK